ncbi:MAG TPA: choice-of-anchor J domain-containing protein [Flavitalea sp.]|nr:choice-of-anchor J domain-containing protein [Flavitalea sp.]
MNKRLFISLLGIFIFIMLMIACEKDPKPDTTPPPPVLIKSFVEEFDTVANLSRKGWVIQNNSDPYGPSAWRQGKYELGGKLGSDVVGFPAFSAVYNQNEFISVDLNAGSGASLISCWLITPPMPMKNGDQVTFYTRTHGDYIDRMQVRGNFTNGSANVGNTAGGVGDFSSLLLDINAAMTSTGYPVDWTKYTLTMTGLPSGQVNGRIAFRYYVPNGGPAGSDGDMIGIDTFSFISK